MPSGFHGATQLARVTLLALLGGVEAATANFTGFTGFCTWRHHPYRI